MCRDKGQYFAALRLLLWVKHVSRAVLDFGKVDVRFIFQAPALGASL